MLAGHREANAHILLQTRGHRSRNATPKVMATIMRAKTMTGDVSSYSMMRFTQ